MSIHYPGEDHYGVREHLCVAIRDEVTAFASWTLPGPGWEQKYPNTEPWGSLDLLAARDDADEATTALLAVWEQRARARGCKKLDSGRPGCSWGWWNVPDCWPHLERMLASAGFRVAETWLTMNGPATVPRGTPPDDDPALTLHWEIHEDQLDWTVKAHAGDAFAGECMAWGIPACFDGSPSYREWITLEWIGVEKDFLHKGVGRRLLSEQIRFQSVRGIRQFTFCGERESTAAFGLAEHFGFRYGPTCHRYRKEIASR